MLSMDMAKPYRYESLLQEWEICKERSKKVDTQPKIQHREQKVVCAIEKIHKQK